jgi:heat shock protein HslJ
MENQTPENQTSGNEGKKDNKNTLIIILIAALALALIGIAFLLFAYVLGNNNGTDPDPEEGGAVPSPVVTVIIATNTPSAPEATLVPLTPEPEDPTAVVTARTGVNVRTGPGLEYAVLGTAPYLTELEITGVSQDGTWWVVAIPPNYNGGQGWVAEEYVEARNADGALVVPAPPTPTPAATATATATPAPEIDFNASRTTINAGEKATLSWSVENITAVYMYPVGDRFDNYPVTGQGSREVQPYITTSYELLTFNPDNSTSAERIEITVINGLTNGRWLLQSYSVPNAGSQAVLPGTEVTARFGTDGSLSGSGGCNNYSGGFMAFDQTLRMSNLTSSKALCADPAGIMEQENAFIGLLNQAAKMKISAGQLEIFDGNGNRILVFING